MSDETRIRQKFEELLDQLLYLTLLYSTSFELLKNNYLKWRFQQNKLIVPIQQIFRFVRQINLFIFWPAVPKKALTVYYVRHEINSVRENVCFPKLMKTS